MNQYVITIGRQFGSGGRTIAKKLAERLNIKYYDKELKKTRHTSPLSVGGNWTQPPIEIDVKLKV